MIRAMKLSMRSTLCAMCLGALAFDASAQTAASTAAKPAAKPAGADKEVTILRTNNKAQANHYVAKVYNFANNNPYNVRRFLQRPLAAEEGAIFTYVNPDYKSGKVLMICPEHQLPYFDKLMAYLDQAGQGTADGSIRDFIPFKNRSVADADFIRTITTAMTTDSWLYTDSELNGIYISDAPSGYDGVKSFLDAEGGKPRDQVDVSVSMYELEMNNDNKIGLDYLAWKNGPGQSLFTAGAFGESEKARDLTLNLNGSKSAFPPPFDSGSGIAGLPGHEFRSSGYYGTYFLDVPSDYFDYLATKGKANMLGMSRMSMLDGETGCMHTGDKLVYYQVSASGESRTVDAKVLETGIQLKVKPIIGAESINFDIVFDDTSLTGFDGSGIPLSATTSYCGKMRVTDGQEIVLAGLNRKTKVDNSQGVPVLKDIPVLGYIFGGKTGLDQQTMVAIVLKPAIMKNAPSNVGPDDSSLMAQAK